MSEESLLNFIYDFCASNSQGFSCYEDIKSLIDTAFSKCHPADYESYPKSRMKELNKGEVPHAFQAPEIQRGILTIAYDAYRLNMNKII